MDTPVPTRTNPSPFELLITCNPPILESLLAQVPTETIFRLYQTSSYLRDFFSRSPTSWRYISWRLYQAAPFSLIATTHNSGQTQRQSSNYALDQILLNVINPFSTRLVSLELDNTAVSGATLTSTVLILRRDTLLHVSVRGCKNVSLKYHINPWLQMHALARESPAAGGPPGFESLALKSLYTYRCRHHRRRPYLPSSLARKESDSEPTHELVLTCHKLGIWTDTAWCTTPGARCYRRRGYVKMRMPQDPREVWVVYDRLWRSRNWLGPAEQSKSDSLVRKRKRDCRAWEFDEEAINGEPVGTGRESKAVPNHLRKSHTQFVENITCHNCSEEILERCEQCSIMMHCTGCRKTLCASCAFDRPYLRNKHAPEEERNKFWWAPGCAVSPCSMQDQDLPPNNGVVDGNPNLSANVLPNIKFKWCCTEPVFSGGGGISFGNGSNRDNDCIRAAPLRSGHGWEDPEFNPDRPDFETLDNPIPGSSSQGNAHEGPGGRWSSIDDLFQTVGSLSPGEHSPVSVPRILCDECYSAEHWKLECKACSTPLCLKHDIGDRVKARICGYKDLLLEKQGYKSRQKALKLLATLMRHRKEKLPSKQHIDGGNLVEGGSATPTDSPKSRERLSALGEGPSSNPFPALTPSESYERSVREAASLNAEFGQFLRTLRTPRADDDLPNMNRPLSPASNSTGPLSRSTSPTPSTHSIPPTPEPNSAPNRSHESPIPKWRGCQAFFCPMTRSPTDHRRRCTAVMRQCVECKVQVCGDCADAMDPPCPCKGCRNPQSDGDLVTVSSNIVSTTQGNPVNAASETPYFFCPNCRWDRMLSGKCKRKSEAFLNSQSLSHSLKKLKKRKDKIRKPLEERRMGSDEAIDGLVEFFSSLNMQFSGMGHAPNMGASTSELDAPTRGNPDDIQELEDMGALARDLIRRIQRLRDQFRPGSLAALALPDIRLEDDDTARLALTGRSIHRQDPQDVQPGVDEQGRIIPDPAIFEEDEEEQFEERESSTD
ncbi:uncharacterized protein Z518_04642 [Rhinocladiella mackenziei CBS 650.93]|uniref:Uncharacterized protein n=1 Tax=Rhinocladiella mackenziei CBS 650.93 TaxID=1442369 RepID=A0A0D2IU22_9EURO|nr:uncharacterized protein Z518_04642 [Rhinocladiella mackenziei CBS 650.93]KIX06666.1 hypothetical protein Z518_04642 [Rhinocladiella mackenziei CBS 650.93]